MTMTNMQTGLDVRQVSFQYGSRKVLHEVSFSLNRGEMVALLGINGCGKTTLLRCLTGFLDSPGGEIRWDGRRLPEVPVSELARLAFLAETNHVPPFPCQVHDLILLGRSAFADRWGNFDNRDRQLAADAAQALGVVPLLERTYQELSHGERQRVRLAMALAADTPYLLLDEPTSHLDPSQQATILRLLFERVRHRQYGVLAVLHDINLARLFDRILVLHEGKIAADGNPQAVIEPETLGRIFGTGLFEVIGAGDAPIGVLRDPRRFSDGGAHS